jgi:DNA-binding MarR family transcriptional regulator
MTSHGRTGEASKIDQMLELLNVLIEKVASVESAPKEFDTGLPLHRSESHAIQAIGQNEHVNVVGLARQLGVTKGAASQMVAKLERKGLVEKHTVPDDARAVALELSPLGRRGFLAHERFHSDMHAAVRQYLRLAAGEGSSQRLASIHEALQDLIEIVETYRQRTANA